MILYHRSPPTPNAIWPAQAAVFTPTTTYRIGTQQEWDPPDGTGTLTKRTKPWMSQRFSVLATHLC